jgi:hypothetical protein
MTPGQYFVRVLLWWLILSAAWGFVRGLLGISSLGFWGGVIAGAGLVIGFFLVAFVVARRAY